MGRALTPYAHLICESRKQLIFILSFLFSIHSSTQLSFFNNSLSALLLLRWPSSWPPPSLTSLPPPALRSACQRSLFRFHYTIYLNYPSIVVSLPSTFSDLVLYSCIAWPFDFGCFIFLIADFVLRVVDLLFYISLCRKQVDLVRFSICHCWICHSRFMAAPPARPRADYDYLIKLLLLGDSGLLTRYQIHFYVYGTNLKY